ncbi:MAG: RNA polymerase factor sigma-54 [Betaproteobacteria bacterium]|nr:RNA polymerase factor sigma-54 [Betaproteobacteria bacterium]
MKQSLQIKLSPHLTLTPQLQQSIRLLQLSTMELNQEIERFLQDNPLLEREEEPEEYGGQAVVASVPPSEFNNSTTSTTTTTANKEENSQQEETPEVEQDWTKGEGGTTNYGSPDDGEDNDYPQVAADQPSLREHLLWQLNLVNITGRDKNMVTVLIECLNEEGYLPIPLEDVAAMLPAELEVDLSELQVALRQLQNLEPVGIGARNLGECLALQIDALPEDVPYRNEALTTVREFLDLLAARDYAKLKKALKCGDDTLRGIQSLVISLNPRPGSDYTKNETRYVVPDVVVRKTKGVWRASLNPDAMPKLRVNRMYADILHRNRDASLQQLSGQLQEAKWLIKNVQQRFDTILRVSQAIVDRQRHFFEHGEVAMKPLVLREIAEILGLHESTVSRVTTQKFMLTPRGIFELKYFFGSHVSTETGGSCSATAIRALIRQLVGVEDSKKPLSDSQISEILGKQGIVVARRTIAKYRESLQILPVNLRKSI